MTIPHPYRFALLSLAFIAFSCFGAACSTSNETAKNSNGEMEQVEARSGEKYSRDQDLTMHLRKINGVLVRGDGSNAMISIRGAEASSFNMNTMPLFVIDGQTINNSYSVVYNMVNRNQIAKIEVLKGADAAAYGIRGANGVIIIDLR
jgi:TonB-dependent SusC/RagA subfamily outer membrane receptor